MLDLYLVLVPLYAIIILLNLIAFKISLTDNTNIANLEKLKIERHAKITFQAQQSPLKRNIKHFLTHFTVMEIFAIRRAKYKLMLLLSISLVSIAGFAFPSPFAFLFMGTLTYFSYLALGMLVMRDEKQQHQSKIWRQKYIIIVFSLMSIIINLIMIGFTYKNYKNSKLNIYISNVGFNLLLDNFVMRPIMSILLAIPMSRIKAVNQYISNIEKQMILLEYYENNVNSIAQCQNESAKRIPFANIDITNDQINQNQLNQSKNLARSIQQIKMMKNGQYYRPQAFKVRYSQYECSLNSILNSTKKQQTSLCLKDPMLTIDQKVSEIPNGNINNNLSTINDNMIVIHPSRQEKQKQQQQIQDIGKKMNTLQSKEEDNPSNFALKLISNDGIQLPIKISYNEPSDPSGPSSKNQPLRIYINGQQKDIQMNYDDNENEIQSERFRRRNSLSNDAMNGEGSNRNYGVLEIKQKNNIIDEIEELDMNSPQRKNRYNNKHDQDSIKLQAIIKKKKKKMSHDERNRVIKFTTGEPYLEYLPNMLSKESKTKKSQALTKKEHILDSRALSNISKKPVAKKRYNENNQNIIPQFHVQDL